MKERKKDKRNLIISILTVSSGVSAANYGRSISSISGDGERIRLTLSGKVLWNIGEFGRGTIYRLEGGG